MDGVYISVLETASPDKEQLKMTREQIITQDPDIHGGVPVFAGTRVPVKSLMNPLRFLQNYETFLSHVASLNVDVK